MKQIILFLLALRLSELTVQANRANVLLFLVDDLRTDISPYRKDSVVKTPNFERFARESTIYENVYSQNPACGPSRASILTGRKPQRLNYYAQNLGGNDENKIWSQVEKSKLMPKYFRAKGYRTAASGKIFHKKEHTQTFFMKALPGKNDQCGKQKIVHPSGPKLHEHAVCEASMEQLSDYKNVEWALQRLEEFSKDKMPWFLAVGINRPHLPYKFPPHITTYYHNLPKESFRTKNYERSTDAWFTNSFCQPLDEYAEVAIRKESTQVGAPVYGEELSKLLRIGYWSSVTWTDELFGKIWAKLEDLKLVEETIIIVTSDHGFQLGENGNWCKTTPNELTTRVPLMVRDPQGLKDRRDNTILSLVDLYPTILDLAGLDALDTLEGKSFASTLRPDVFPDIRKGSHQFSFSVAARCADFSNKQLLTCNGKLPMAVNVVGYSVRTSKYRYIEWRKFAGYSKTADWSEAGLLEVQLYEEEESSYSNPDDVDNLNLAKEDNIDKLPISKKQKTSTIAQVQKLKAQFSKLIKKEFHDCKNIYCEAGYCIEKETSPKKNKKNSRKRKKRKKKQQTDPVIKICEVSDNIEDFRRPKY